MDKETIQVDAHCASIKYPIPENIVKDIQNAMIDFGVGKIFTTYEIERRKLTDDQNVEMSNNIGQQTKGSTKTETDDDMFKFIIPDDDPHNRFVSQPTLGITSVQSSRISKASIPRSVWTPPKSKLTQNVSAMSNLTLGSATTQPWKNNMSNFSLEFSTSSEAVLVQEFKGSLPGKPRIKQLAAQLKTTQKKVRRWFTQRIEQSSVLSFESPPVPQLPVKRSSSELSTQDKKLLLHEFTHNSFRSPSERRMVELSIETRTDYPTVKEWFRKEALNASGGIFWNDPRVPGESLIVHLHSEFIGNDPVSFEKVLQVSKRLNILPDSLIQWLKLRNLYTE